MSILAPPLGDARAGPAPARTRGRSRRRSPRPHRVPACHPEHRPDGDPEPVGLPRLDGLLDLAPPPAPGLPEQSDGLDVERGPLAVRERPDGRVELAVLGDALVSPRADGDDLGRGEQARLTAPALRLGSGLGLAPLPTGGPVAALVVAADGGDRVRGEVLDVVARGQLGLDVAQVPLDAVGVELGREVEAWALESPNSTSLSWTGASSSAGSGASARESGSTAAPSASATSDASPPSPPGAAATRNLTATIRRPSFQVTTSTRMSECALTPDTAGLSTRF